MKELKMGRVKTIKCLESIVKILKEELNDPHFKNKYFTWCRYFPAKGKRGIFIKIIK